MRAYSHRPVALICLSLLCGCGGSGSETPSTTAGGAAAGPPTGEAVAARFGPSGQARGQISAPDLRRYQAAGRRVGIDWAVVAATDQIEGGGGNPLSIAYTLSSFGAPQSYETALRARGGSLQYARRILRLADSLRGPPRGDPIPVDSGRLLVPLRGPLLSRFGDRFGILHGGIDFGARSGQLVRAAASGTVVYAGPRGAFGNSVCVAHRLQPPLRGASLLTTCYGNLAAIDVSLGRTVRRGQGLGSAGCSGNCASPRMHLEVRRGTGTSAPVEDPLHFLQGRG